MLNVMGGMDELLHTASGSEASFWHFFDAAAVLRHFWWVGIGIVLIQMHSNGFKWIQTT
jgi:hypothetical protein